MSDSLIRSPSYSHSVSFNPDNMLDSSDIAGAGAADRTNPALSTSPNSSNNSSNPLHLFVRAKKKINEAYKEIGDYMNSVNRFLSTTVPELAVDKDDKVAGYVRKVDAIREVLRRDHMKVVFFGRTSNGKSTAINALLGDKILPMGIGHTTSCFLQIEGGGESDAFLLTEGSEEKKNVKSISQLGNALCSEKLDSSAKVRIIWPKERCKMLAEEVVIIDSPGIDVETDLDEWIDKFCLDSDVFVLVANANPR